MRYITFFLCAAMLVSCSTNDPYKKLDKLSGLWQMNTGKGMLYEEWSESNNNVMNGKSYMMEGTDTTIFERVELKKIGDSVFYIPVVAENNNQPVRFTLISSSDSSFTFENKLHDFPQRVIYRFFGKDSIAARIEGVKNGKERSSDFNYNRVQKP